MAVKDKARMLPVGPFQDWLKERYTSIEYAALQTGVRPETIRRAWHARRPQISEDVVDRALLDWPERIDDLYPDPC